MNTRKVVQTLMIVLALGGIASAQFLPPPPCATKLQSSMLCVVPQVYGTGGLILPNPSHQAHFERQASSGFFLPVNVSVGTELSLLPLASPASGVLFTFDKALGTVTRANESYGPVLSERAETIGKHHLYVAGTYQFFDFTSLDGVDLKHFPVVFSHASFLVNGVMPPYEQDYITTVNRVDVKAHEVTFYGTYGLTDRVDVSVAVPILDVRLAIGSAAHIVRVAPQPVAPTDPEFASTNGTGFYHYFDPADPAGSVDKLFTNAQTSSGLGDVTFRVKGTVLRGERGRVALGMSVRTPTGNETKFLGSGALGVKPFLAASYRARVSPHVNLGFEWNGKSILAGDLVNATTGKLPNQFIYSAGFDIGVTRRWTLAADLLGNRLSSTDRVRTAPYVDINGVARPELTQTVVYRGSANMDDIAIGTKFSPIGNLLVTANVAFKVNDPGLRATAVPLVGLSYTF